MEDDFTKDMRVRATERIVSGLSDWTAMYGTPGDGMQTYSVWVDKASLKVIGIDQTSANSVACPPEYVSCTQKYVRALDELDALKKYMGITK